MAVLEDDTVTTLLGGQNYVSVAFVLPIITSLLKHLQKTRNKLIHGARIR